MSYYYQEHRAYFFTEEGSAKFIAVRDRFLADARKVGGLLKSGHIFTVVGAGNSFQTMAFLDRMVELGDVKILETKAPRAWQDQIVEVKS